MSLRPAYRYFEPIPQERPGRWATCVRWALPLSAVLWFVILGAGFLIERSVT
jgi:hypothetical protein